MAPRTLPTEDEWRHVEDAKKRKQIQDRLAQRARRQRLREAKINAKQQKQQCETSERVETQGEEQQPAQQQPQQQTQMLVEQQPLLEPSRAFPSNLVDLPSYTEIDLEMRPADMDIAKCPLSLLANQNSPADIPSKLNELCLGDTTASTSWLYPLGITKPIDSSRLPKLYEQPALPLTVVSAMYLNGNVLGLKCGTVVPARSTPCGADVPLTLQPTYMQLTIMHSRWIDRFPFPKMRDCLISLGGLVDDEELLNDMMLMPSFIITPGKAPWDPKAWTIQKPFADKWGFLFLR